MAVDPCAEKGETFIRLEHAGREFKAAFSARERSIAPPPSPRLEKCSDPRWECGCEGTDVSLQSILQWTRHSAGPRSGFGRNSGLMSVEYSVALVDWERFSELWREHQDSGFLFDETSASSGWSVEIGLQPHWISSWSATISFSDAYRDMRQYLDATVQESFEAFFRAFCLADEDETFHPPRDLGEGIDELTFWATIAPETARRYLALWDALDIERLRPAHSRLDPARSDRHVRTFERFCQQPKMWADLLRAAVAKGAGIVIITA